MSDEKDSNFAVSPVLLDKTTPVEEDFRSIMDLPVDEMMQAFDLIARNRRSAQPVIDDVTAIAMEIV